MLDISLLIDSMNVEVQSMQHVARSYSNTNRDVLKLISELIERHPHMRLLEIMDKFNIANVHEEDKHTPPDAILARTYKRLHELR